MKYSEPVSQLLKLGDPREQESRRNWIDYQALGLSEKDIPQLIELLKDWDLYNAEEGGPEIYSMLHSWRALGQLKAKEAILPLIEAFNEAKYNDWALEELPEVMSMIGKDAIHPIQKYLYDDSKDEFARVCAADSLKEIGLKLLEKRELCIEILSTQLQQATSKTPSLNSLTIGFLVDMKATSAIEAIRDAFDKRMIDFQVCGDLEDVEIELGLRDSRSTPRPRYGMFNYHKQIPKPEKKKKIGRNEPCSCGSGNKYKKCCLQKAL